MAEISPASIAGTWNHVQQETFLSNVSAQAVYSNAKRLESTCEQQLEESLEAKRRLISSQLLVQSLRPMFHLFRINVIFFL